jgi:mRNA interferase MazF
VLTAAKRGIHSIHEALIAKKVGRLAEPDAQRIEQALRQWLGLD